MLDPAGRFVGAVSLHDFGPFLRQQASAAAALAPQLVLRDYPRVSGDAGLGEILAAFSRHAGERLPVVDAAGVLQGYLSKTEVMLVLQER